MGLRKVKQLLIALTNPLSPDSAGPERHEGMNNLISAVGGMGPGVEKAGQPLQPVGGAGEEEKPEGHEGHDRKAQMRQPDPAHKKHQPGDGPQDDHGAEIRLKNNQAGDDRQDQDMRQKSDGKLPDSLVLPAHGVSQVGHQGKPGKLGRLKGKLAQPEPAGGPAGRHPHPRQVNGHQENHRKRQHRVNGRPKNSQGNRPADHQGHQPEAHVSGLFFKEIDVGLELLQGHGRRGAVNHDQPDAHQEKH